MTRISPRFSGMKEIFCWECMITMYKKSRAFSDPENFVAALFLRGHWKSPQVCFFLMGNPRNVLGLSLQRWRLTLSIMVETPLDHFFSEYLWIPSRSSTARPTKVSFPIGKANVFQPPFFRGELLNFGLCMSCFCHLKQANLKYLRTCLARSLYWSSQKNAVSKALPAEPLLFWQYCSLQK